MLIECCHWHHEFFFFNCCALLLIPYIFFFFPLICELVDYINPSPECVRYPGYDWVLSSSIAVFCIGVFRAPCTGAGPILNEPTHTRTQWHTHTYWRIWHGGIEQYPILSHWQCWLKPPLYPGNQQPLLAGWLLWEVCWLAARSVCLVST